jgi:hypothetical protein
MVLALAKNCPADQAPSTTVSQCVLGISQLTSAQVGLQLKRSHRPYAGFMAAPLKSDDENTASADSASAASELNGLDAQDA